MIFYPPIFHHESTGYSVSVPDLDGCFSQGNTLTEALEMITDAIGLFLDGMKKAPPASSPETIIVPTGDFMLIVPFDPLAYQRKHNTRSVKKTLTIPAWLNEAAEAAHINFSGILQEALKEKLNIK